jgi:hypothetical protein
MYCREKVFASFSTSRARVMEEKFLGINQLNLVGAEELLA